jgi:hypothetical protein
MTEKVTLAEREKKLQADIASLVEEDVAAVTAGADPANSDKIVRFIQDLNVIHAAIERQRGTD